MNMYRETFFSQFNIVFVIIKMCLTKKLDKLQWIRRMNLLERLITLNILFNKVIETYFMAVYKTAWPVSDTNV